MNTDKHVHIFGGGTISHVRCHLALSTPAYGNTAMQLYDMAVDKFKNSFIDLWMTKMTDPHHNFNKDFLGDTNEDVAARLQYVVDDPRSKVIFFNVALCDWDAEIVTEENFVSGISEHSELVGSPSGKYETRLETKNGEHLLRLTPATKLLPMVRQLPNSHGKVRKDITLVAFKTTCGATGHEMYLKGLELLKKNSCNLVLVNDVKTKINMIVTPEESSYHETKDRKGVLENLVDMAWHRSQLTFTQSTVVEGKTVGWDNALVPDNLRQVVNHCIKGRAYKPFLGSTVGHFAVKLSDTEFLTSIRKSNFNDLDKIGLVYVKTDGPDTVIAYGAKPSVGGQSQRTVFRDHPGYDCIVHFHSPLRADHKHDIPVISQREVECGSHQCGKNTSNGLKEFVFARVDESKPLDDHHTRGIKTQSVKAVMLDQHGPNIVFSKDTDAETVIQFIEDNFDLSQKTGGYQLPNVTDG